MDPIIFLLLDAAVLVIATVILSYFFIKDMYQQLNKRKKEQLISQIKR